MFNFVNCLKYVSNVDTLFQICILASPDSYHPFEVEI